MMKNLKLDKIGIALIISSFVSIVLIVVISLLLGNIFVFDLHKAISLLWISFIFIVFPVASVIIGIICLLNKNRKGIIYLSVGITIIGILLFFGSMSFDKNRTFDNEEVRRIEKMTNCKFPTNISVITYNYENYKETNIEILDNNEKRDYETNITNDERWKNEASTKLSSYLPHTPFIDGSLSNYKWFMFYNVDKEEYNSFPDEKGIYEYVYISYDILNNHILIISNYYVET